MTLPDRLLWLIGDADGLFTDAGYGVQCEKRLAEAGSA